MRGIASSRPNLHLLPQQFATMPASTPAPESPVRIAESDSDILFCSPCMRELRPHLDEASFIARIRAQQSESGYTLAFIEQSGVVACVAGFRIASFLAWGRTLYLDDLSTSSGARRNGHAGRMLEWLFARARAESCDLVHLDSGMQRHEAHRLYLSKRFQISSLHFSRPVAE
jgi:GNAT superfamily N-acetyltransferase